MIEEKKIIIIIIFIFIQNIKKKLKNSGLMLKISGQMTEVLRNLEILITHA